LARRVREHFAPKKFKDFFTSQDLKEENIDQIFASFKDQAIASKRVARRSK
jgi:hypothetical protein